jgi:hypothetical protein
VILGILKGLDLARIAAYAAVIAALVGTIWFHGYAKGSNKLDRYKSEQAQEGTRIIIARAKATERVITKYVQVAGQTKTVTETIQKEVIRYADKNTDNCPLSIAAVRLHDAAAANELPKPSGATDGAASGLEAASLTQACAQNYARYHEAADRLRGLQAWVAAQAAVK